MNIDDGTLSFGTAIDMSGFEQGMNNIEQQVSEIGAKVEIESARISELLNNIPIVNIDFVTNVSQSLNTIDAAFGEIDNVVNQNKEAIRELEAEYERLSQVDTSNDSAEGVNIEALNQQKQAIQENIALRQQIIEEAAKTADALLATETSLRTEAETMTATGLTIREQLGQIGEACMQHEQVLDSLEKAYQDLQAKMNKAFSSGNDEEYFAIKKKSDAIKQELTQRKKQLSELRKQSDALEQQATELEKSSEAAKKTSKSHSSFETQLRRNREELVAMEAAGQRGTAQYQALQEETARLTKAWKDATEQSNVLAHDQRGMQGIISGLSGMSGAFTATQGAISLFVGENEDLQKVMLKVQSLMAITMGLQQVQATLDKDSAFRLVTLNGLKEWWNKLLQVGAGVQAAEAAATASETAAEVANTGATVANTAAKQANAGATGVATAATGANTAGQVVNTGAAVAGTAANIGLAGAFRMVGAAIKSIPVFGWIAAGISALISVVSHFIGKANEADKEFEEQQELLEESRKVYLKASVEIEDYTRKIENFNGTSEQEKKLINELNNKYGEHLGYCDSLSKWKTRLKEKGEIYCYVLMLEAQAQAILNKYTEAYINLLEVKGKAEKGDYDDEWYEFWNWGGKSSKEKRAEAISDAESEMKKWEKQYKDLQQQILNLKDENDLNFHADPTIKTVKGKGKEFDPKMAILEQKKAIKEYRDAVRGFIQDANDEITQMTIDAQEEGLTKEINNIAYNTFQKKRAWQDQLRQLAEVRMQAEKDLYMSQKGATEVGWAESEKGKMSISDWEQELLKNPKIYEEYYRVLNQITKNGEEEIAKVRQEYHDALIDEFGTLEQKTELLTRRWMAKLAYIPQEFLQQAIDQMEKDFSNLEITNFKLKMDWEGVFGNLDEQSLQALQYNLDKVKTYFEKTKDSMSATEIKDFQEAISKMETEIASRNPFAALHKSLRDISSSKEEFITAMDEWKAAQQEQTAMQDAYNLALENQRLIQEQVNNSELTEESQEYKDAEEALTTAKTNLSNATIKVNNAEQRTLTARNKITASYKSFANNLRNVGGVVKDLGGKAQNLAEAFGSDIAHSIGKAVDFIDDILGATSDVISAIGDVGKGVAEGVESTVSATAQGTTAAAAAGASAISTIEKASVILAVISAALQIATAIANLFNNDDEKQEEIERLQRRIDQLQWELDNAEAMRVSNATGDAYKETIRLLKETETEILTLHGFVGKYANGWYGNIAKMIYKNEILQSSIEKIADKYAELSYTVDKALGSEKYDKARGDLKNLAEQQILLQQQINAEEDKKDTDHGKIEEWQRQMQENAAEMVAIINEMVEDIIGFTAEDLASELGNAFFDAFKEGEDAAEAWGKKVNEIVADILKRMMIQELLEKPIGQIFDRYKKKWFGSDGTFQGFDAVEGSLTGFADELNALVTTFSGAMEDLPDELKELLLGDVEREGIQKGIATASQESVDENNARMTTIQGHTYTLVQGQAELNRTTNLILERVTGIERNTSETNTKLDNMNRNVKEIKDAVDDVATRGIKLKS